LFRHLCSQDHSEASGVSAARIRDTQIGVFLTIFYMARIIGM